MNLFAQVPQTVSDSVVDNSGGSSKFAVPATDGYQATVAHAFLRPNHKNPANTELVLRFDFKQGYQFDLVVYSVLINGKPFSDKKDKQGNNLPTYGFSQATRIAAACTNGGDLVSHGATEPKTIALYNYEQSKELPTEVQMISAFVGATVFVGMTRKIQNKRTLVDAATNEWADLPEKVQKAELSQIASPEGFTKSEYAAGATTPQAFQEWVTANKGKDWDAYVPVANVGSPVASMGAGAPTGNAAPIQFS